MAMLVQGCSWLGIGGDEGWLRDREGEYLEARITPVMDIPAELDSYTIDQLYYIPPEAPGEREVYVVPPAPKPIDTRVREGVVIQRFGDRAWIVVGATPGQVWPTLRDYFATEGLPVASEDAVAGVVETEWVPQDDSDVRNRYRVRVEPGLHAGNSEVYILQVDDEGETAEGQAVTWPSDSENLEREATMLASLSMYLADRTDIYRGSSVSMLAGSIEAQGKARLDDSESGSTRLELRIDFDRAWSQVGQAIGNAEIELLSSDRDERRYIVSFTGTENQEEPGFFGRLFGRDEEVEARQFDVTLSDTADGILVEARVSDGAPAPYQQDLLVRTINDNLI
ncbi:outer membrane protein assembly factor BamC [Pseudohongiella sp. SYSU M77423]|uniref:outer membrane protein assembly factor BamC n=1 Tax=unclassified Pseudohongiella TaxID=2629611 RepID=UPI001F1D156E|nr:MULTISPECIES: outer membrane protein assembly factor BamC [unclassified Pseudohongiella]MDH7944921.1 outer membrane protein assembly factor BamC [Pseudohongiella sp. SYSU M77423]MEC8858371.1 outer membrane protein assembly factor BamC [Pseudomonadota bacterium]|tara:strand:- start:1943 stop:2959 length:1017 start_codon:yes stop_codon:yes gene_type:complete